MKDPKNRWITFWRRIWANGNPDAVYNKLIISYSEPHRVYHTINRHIVPCLDEFELARHLPRYPNEVEMALWFHDAVYDTRSKNNEERSAQLAYQVSIEAGLPDTFAWRVHDFILMTKYNAISEEVDAQVLVDVDLSILGRPVVEFDEYERNIRKEYSWVPEEQFKTGRTAILQEFLNRPNIYFTDFFRKKYKTQARRNLERSLAKLK